MTRLKTSAFLIVVAVSASAHADSLTASRPGLMCASAEALAKLTLPDGSSKAASATASARDLDLKESGGCIDIQPGTHVSLVSARKNTSIGNFARSDGVAETMYVPNVDFARQPVLVGASSTNANDGSIRFYSALAKACPKQGWTEHALSHLEVGPLDAVYSTMTQTQQAAAQKKADVSCTDVGGQSCPSDVMVSYMVSQGLMARMIHKVCAQKAPAS